jgi:Mg/Co/Ni transporter MgtE (contains CBS domain)
LEGAKEPYEDEESLNGASPYEDDGLDVADVLNEQLEQAFESDTHQLMIHDVSRIALEFDPIDLAHAVTRLPPSSRVVLYENLPDWQAKIIFMINTSRYTRSAIFKQIDDREVMELVGRMPSDEAVFVLDDLSERRLRRILEQLEPKKATRIRELRSHDRLSAGGMMSNEFFAFPLNTRVGEVSRFIRDNPGIDLTSRIFVLNEAGQLIGFVSDRNLIISKQDLPLRQIMGSILHKVFTDTSRDDVVDLVERYSMPALPVVDDNDRLVGVISFEDAVDAMKDIADETIASIAGTAEEVGEEEPRWRRVLWRAPWLLVTLCAGITTSSFMTHFRDRWWFTFVPFFVPLITGMSGNVGIQCSTVLVRGMSTGELSPGSRREAVISELITGMMIGISFGILSGLLIFALNHFGIYTMGDQPLLLSLMVSCGLLGACLTASCLGSISPLLFQKFNIDPAVASGPIVAALNDMLSTLMFILIAFIIHIVFM